MLNPESQPLDDGEPTEERNARRARGEITSEEMQEYLTHPQDVLFEHELGESKIKVRALTREFMDSTLESLKDSWDEPTFNDLKGTLRKYFEQKESGRPALLNVEYFIATDEADKPMAMTGFYSVDIEGGAGLATREKLDAQKHSFNLSLAYSITAS